MKGNFQTAKFFYDGITKENLEDYHPNFAESVVEESEIDRLTKIVFAPDETGNPTSDIEYYLNCGDDGFRDYMRRTLLQRCEGEISNDDPELIEATLKKNLQTYDQYFNAMDAYARSMIDGEVK